MWGLWTWLIAMCLQILLLCRQLHCVMLLSDLETDIQNPHDWAREMKRFRVRDRGVGSGERARAAAAIPHHLNNTTTSTPPQNTKTKQQTAEYIAQPLLAALLLLSGRWLLGTANALLAAFVLAVLLRQKQDHCEPADAFRDAPLHRRNRTFLLACHAVLFAVASARLVQHAVAEMLAHHEAEHGGGEAGAAARAALARELMREAAASVHAY